MMKYTVPTSTLYRHYNLPILFPYMTFFGDHWILDDAPVYPRHFHNCIELGYCKSGSGTLFIENSVFSFHTGDYAFIPENITHTLQASPGTKSSWEYAYFDPYFIFQNALPESMFNHLANHFGIISEDREEEIHFLMKRIFIELHQKESYYQDSLKGHFLSLLMLVERNTYLEHSYKPDFQWLYSAISHIRKNYGKKLSIAEIAQTCSGMSESHFRKKFTEIMRIRPLDYISHLRIRIACQAIYKNEKPINEIASDVGFTTLSSFNRNFQALLHRSPSEWRKQHTDVLEITSLEERSTQGVFTP